MFFDRYKELFNNNSRRLDELNTQIDLDEITSAEFFEAVGQIVNMSAAQIKAEFERDLVLDARLASFIKNLKPHYKIGLLSNAGSEEILIVDKAGIGNLFDARAISCEVGTAKPHPKIFQICTERLAVQADECIYIDDSKANLPPAEALGMKTILYTDFEDFKQRFEALIAST